MNKNIKLLMVIMAVFFVLPTANIYAQNILEGSGCGLGGKCELLTKGCPQWDDVEFSNSCLEKEQCCIPTRCSNNSIGFGECKSSGSCVGGFNTSNCLPPKICCVENVKEQGNMYIGPIDSTPGQGSDNVFTGGADQAGQTVIPNEGKTGGLVPCLGVDPVTGQRDCTLCDVFKLIKNLINLFIQLTFAFAGGFIVWGAIEIMTAGGAEERVKSGKEKVTTAIYGIVIVLAAWLLVGTVLQILTNSSSVLPWNKIQC